MAVGDILGSLKDTVKNAYNNFFYSGRQAPARKREAYRDTCRKYLPCSASRYSVACSIQ